MKYRVHYPGTVSYNPRTGTTRSVPEYTVDYSDPSDGTAYERCVFELMEEFEEFERTAAVATFSIIEE